MRKRQYEPSGRSSVKREIDIIIDYDEIMKYIALMLDCHTLAIENRIILQLQCRLAAILYAAMRALSSSIKISIIDFEIGKTPHGKSAFSDTRKCLYGLMSPHRGFYFSIYRLSQLHIIVIVRRRHRRTMRYRYFHYMAWARDDEGIDDGRQHRQDCWAYID